MTESNLGMVIFPELCHATKWTDFQYNAFIDHRKLYPLMTYSSSSGKSLHAVQIYGTNVNEVAAVIIGLYRDSMTVADD